MDLLRRRPYLLSYVLLVTVTVVGFWRLESVISRQDVERRDRTTVVCQALNEGKDLVRFFTDVLINVSKTTPTTAPITPDRQRQQEVAIEQFLSALEPKLQHIDCTVFLHDPSTFLTPNTTTLRSPLSRP